ncbi:response regulator, partial [Actinoplanes sp. NPDC051633]|uniref:response regulator n=1 Tax=Actinoplanes sp. NPDC051633 TaxID=3155670 RepID=UPI00342D2B35
MRVVLVDGSPLHRAGLRATLTAGDPTGSGAGFTVVGEGFDGAAAVDLARRLVPDVVVLDAALARVSGIEAARAIRGAGLPVRVLVLADDDGD